MQKSYECEVGAVVLADVPAGESPAGGTCSVATVVLSSDWKGDRPVERLEVNGTPRMFRTRQFVQKVLAHMQAAERGFRRLDAALDIVGPEPLAQLLRSLKSQSIDRVDNLQTLREIVLALEAAAQGTAMKQ